MIAEARDNGMHRNGGMGGYMDGRGGGNPGEMEGGREEGLQYRLLLMVPLAGERERLQWETETCKPQTSFRSVFAMQCYGARGYHSYTLAFYTKTLRPRLRPSGNVRRVDCIGNGMPNLWLLH